MRRWFVSAIAVLAVAGCIGAGEISDVGPVDEAGGEFPHVTGINLHGETVTLPAGFDGTRNLVAVGFERDHQSAIDAWIGVADALAARHADFRFYELPTIFPINFAWRLWVNNGMRSGIPSDHARARTITLYLERDEFTEALAIPDMTQIHVLLLDEAGKVLWRTTGPATEADRRALEGVLAAG